MKVKVSLLVTAVAILKTIDTTKMKLSVSYKVKQVLKKCEGAIQDFEAKRVALAEAHGTLSEDKTHYAFDEDEARESFQSGMKEIMEDEIDIDIRPIPIDLIDDYIDIEPHNVEFVEWFITGLAE